MKPESIPEQLMYSTVRLKTESGCGTGSYFNYKIGNCNITVIITNKHVVNDNEHEKVTFLVYTKDNNGHLSGNVKIQYDANWIFHEDKDICFCYVNPIFEKVKSEYHKEVFCITNDAELIPSQKELEELDALEELVMVGYPIGLWDQVNNFPIFRKGFTACHPRNDFNQKGIGLVDMACFPGSSGSPIYIFNNSGYSDKRGTVHIGSPRFFLIGYLFAGPQYTANGSLITETIPTRYNIMPSTPIMVNLGYYVKSAEILSFIDRIKQDYYTSNLKVGSEQISICTGGID